MLVNELSMLFVGLLDMFQPGIMSNVCVMFYEMAKVVYMLKTIYKVLGPN